MSKSIKARHVPKPVGRCDVKTIWALLLPAEQRFSWWKWIDVRGLSLCTSYPAAALKDLNQLHRGEMYFYVPSA